jgi:hypothetical protein
MSWTGSDGGEMAAGSAEERGQNIGIYGRAVKQFIVSTSQIVSLDAVRGFIHFRG